MMRFRPYPAGSNHPHMMQDSIGNYQPYGQIPQAYQASQTPFEQFKKPTLPFEWPEIQAEQPMPQQEMTQPVMAQQVVAQPVQPMQAQQPMQAIQPVQPMNEMQGQQMQQVQALYGGFEQMNMPISNRPPSLWTQFQNESGQIDVNKMLSTVGQLANTVQQVTPVVKQLGDFIKGFR